MVELLLPNINVHFEVTTQWNIYLEWKNINSRPNKGNKQLKNIL